jgi:hypothetical protein
MVFCLKKHCYCGQRSHNPVVSFVEVTVFSRCCFRCNFVSFLFVVGNVIALCLAHQQQPHAVSSTSHTQLNNTRAPSIGGSGRDSQSELCNRLSGHLSAHHCAPG